ncbi:hypothetical protein [Mycobacterium marinum]|uniref:hypothetical protein n=1 Tax=Mycobacterium marinum TaxID=1781 RepID=UPI00356A1AC9
MSEPFFVLSGSMRVYDELNWIDASAGDYLYVPLDGIRGFRIESQEPSVDPDRLRPV